MTINGQEVDFDLDMRTDYAKFAKAFQAVEAVSKKGKMTDIDMEKFLSGCLKKEDAEKLLSDGRMSTLAKVFMEFFSEAVTQAGTVSEGYNEAANAFASAMEKALPAFAERRAAEDKIKNLAEKQGG